MSVNYCRICPRVINGSRDPYCEACRPRDYVTKPGRYDALERGEWVLDPVRRVLVWKEAPPKPKRVASSTAKNRRDWFNMGDCPKCEARAGQACRSSGRTVPAHRARYAEALCIECGDDRTDSGHRYHCAPCYLAYRRAQYRAKSDAFRRRQEEAA